MPEICAILPKEPPHGYLPAKICRTAKQPQNHGNSTHHFIVVRVLFFVRFCFIHHISQHRSGAGYNPERRDYFIWKQQTEEQARAYELTPAPEKETE